MKYVNFDILPDGNLKITLTNEGREEITELKQKYGDNDEAIFSDLIEYQLGNGYHWVQLKDIAALTDSLIISDMLIDEETTEEEINATNVWWYPDYMVRSYLDGIENEGVIFIKA